MSYFSSFDKQVLIITSVNLISISSTIVELVIMQCPDPYLGARVVMITDKAVAEDFLIPKMSARVT